MASVYHFGLFGIIFLTLLGIVSNSSENSLDRIQTQMYLMNCPFPLYDAVATVGNPSYIGFQLNYTLTFGTGGSNTTGTYFRCYVDPTSNPEYQINVQTKNYGETAFGFIPIGWLSYIGDNLSVAFVRIVAFFTLISYFVSPSNFDILGYTIADITGVALLFVILLYGLCYVFIGAMIYKIVSPASDA